MRHAYAGLSGPDLEKMGIVLDQGIKFLESLQTAAAAFRAGIHELERYRESIASGTINLDWNEALKKLAETDPAVYTACQGAELVKFDMGRLDLRASGQQYSTLSIFRSRLEAFLREQFGASFKVRIKTQN
jgi:hypothetical protein